MTDLNEYECEMLDTILGSFDLTDSLTRRQLLALFDGDEATAYAMIQALSREQLVTEAGSPGRYELPEKLLLEPQGLQFLKEGGFVKRYQKEQETIKQTGGTYAKLEQEKQSLEADLQHLRQTLKQKQTRSYLLIALIVAALITGYFLGQIT